MKGWLVEEFGGPEVMQWAEIPNPVPGPDEVVVDVHASVSTLPKRACGPEPIQV